MVQPLEVVEDEPEKSAACDGVETPKRTIKERAERTELFFIVKWLV